MRMTPILASALLLILSFVALVLFGFESVNSIFAVWVSTVLLFVCIWRKIVFARGFDQVDPISLEKDKEVKAISSDEFVSRAIDCVLATILLLSGIVASTVFCLLIFGENADARLFVAENILSSHECSSFVRAAEKEALQRGGWDTKRHRNYPTTDLVASSIREPVSLTVEKDSLSAWAPGGEETVQPAGEWISQVIDSRVLPRVAYFYHLELESLVMRDLFLVKYDAVKPAAQRRLAIHQDSSMISFNIALSIRQGDETRNAVFNRTTDPGGREEGFRGGGTYFALMNRVVQLSQGALLVHPSKLYHSGQEVTEGVRYILVGFVDYKPPAGEGAVWDTWWRFWGWMARCAHVKLVIGQHHTDVDILKKRAQLNLQVGKPDAPVVKTKTRHSFNSSRASSIQNPEAKLKTKANLRVDSSLSHSISNSKTDVNKLRTHQPFALRRLTEKVDAEKVARTFSLLGVQYNPLPTCHDVVPQGHHAEYCQSVSQVAIYHFLATYYDISVNPNKNAQLELAKTIIGTLLAVLAFVVAIVVGLSMWSMCSSNKEAVPGLFPHHD